MELGRQIGLLVVAATVWLGACQPQNSSSVALSPAQKAARLESAMMRGDSHAADEIAEFYSDGENGFADREKLRWYILTAEHGSPVGAWHVGNSLYALGDCARAAVWFRKAHEIHAMRHVDTSGDDEMITEMRDNPNCRR